MVLSRHLLPITGLMVYALCASGAHITDKLLVGLYEKPVEQGQPLRVLPSGTPVEILQSKEPFSLVRLGDQTEGWVQTRYLTDEKPAQVMLLEAQARASALAQELRATQETLEKSRNELAALKDSKAPQHLARLSQQLEEAQTSKAGDFKSGRLWYLLLSTGLTLVGFIGGIAFARYRLRKRFGGLRL